jgi:hypothetical protein
VVCAIAAVAIAGCGQSIEVRTMAAPDAGLATLHSFRILEGPVRRDGRRVTGLDDPMIDNSIANRTIREAIVRAFQERGYTFNEMRADFAVAFYASATQKLDVSEWDYGYPYPRRWPYPGARGQTITQYTEGSVVIDVINASTHELLWRGEGTAHLTDDTSQDLKRLAKAAEAIVAKFPRASAVTVAAMR